ncbi:MAG: class I SAM-dependent methyltransferase [Candidatus Diapherotrites archaeon]|uniref:Class I SAM-dependent methyltransferase n=1 Tax=Candidatus Iainarchaeum sp. TaxID=3101447 RepID=A0A939C6L5_9ARCH|nr:class I SAM-dependent methyltransferase [Candidatus Diapherotrites archaeon]
MAGGKNRVCPVERAGSLEHWLRKLLQNPNGIVGRYLKPGMSAIDFGCGPGIFSIEMAKMVGGKGRVFAVDLQQGMLDRLAAKIKGTKLSSIIKLHRCSENSIGLKEKLDFVLAFYVVHEVPDQTKLFQEIKSLMKPNAMLLVVEPSFHVSKKEFQGTVEKALSLGFKAIEMPRVFFSRSVLLGLK